MGLLDWLLGPIDTNVQCKFTGPHKAHRWYEEEPPSLYSDRFIYDEYYCPGRP